MDRLSVCRLLILQTKFKLGRKKPSTGLRVRHSWSMSRREVAIMLQFFCRFFVYDKTDVAIDLIPMATSRIYHFACRQEVMNHFC